MAKKTYLEIRKQIDQLEKEAARLRSEESGEVLARIKEAIAVYGFSASDLGFGAGAGPRTGRKPAPAKRGRPAGKKKAAMPMAKYRDQDGNAWGGRGPRPAWFKAALEAGKSVEDLLAK